MISTSAANAGAKISEIVEKVFFLWERFDNLQLLWGLSPQMKKSSFYLRSRSCSGGSGDLFAAINLAVAIVVNLEMAVGLCRHVVARKDAHIYICHCVSMSA